jgi:hypothetical protein
MAVDHLTPIQVGVGVKDGIEGIIHGLNRFIRHDSFPKDSVIALIDFQNAFNQISRQTILDHLLLHFPAIVPWYQFTYGCSPLLFVGREWLLSKAGVQQGDPLSPLFFAIALQPLLLEIQQKFKVSVSAYLDDLTIVAKNEKTADDCIRYLIHHGKTHGLVVSTSKSVIWSPYRVIQRPFEGFQLAYSGVKLLGSAVSLDENFIQQVAFDRVHKCKQEIEDLLALDDPQICLMLLRSCLGMAKLNYIWRTIHPDILKPASLEMQKSIECALRRITVADGPGFGDFQLQISSLPIIYGGLGISLPSDLIHFTYLASQLSTIALQKKLFPILPTTHHHLQALKDSFSNTVQHNEPLPHLQHNLAKLYFANKCTNVKNHPCRERDPYSAFIIQHNTILDSIRLKNASAWKLALPNEGLQQRMNPHQYRAALRFNLLIPIYHQAHPCPAKNCKCIMDVFGYHALACGGIGNTRTARHNTLVCSLVQLARQAGFQAKKDPPIILPWKDNLNREVMLRPADLSISGDNNISTCIDVTIVSNLSPSYIGTTPNPGKCVTAAAKEKVKKHAEACRHHHLDFIPFAVDVCGVFDEAAQDLIDRLATSYHTRSSKPFSMCMSICSRRISFAVQLAVANQLMVPIYNSRWVSQVGSEYE